MTASGPLAINKPTDNWYYMMENISTNYIIFGVKLLIASHKNTNASTHDFKPPMWQREMETK